MRMQYFGDSYDIVKQALLIWLRELGDWSVHPMFTEVVSDHDVAAFEALIGGRVISTEILAVDSDRSAYFQPGSRCGNLFLDPDTGLRMLPTRGFRAPEYIFASELLELAGKRPSSLTVVFDQSVGRGSERLHIADKLRQLSHQNLHGFAYVSHACFLLVGRDRALVDHALKAVIHKSKLPDSRFITTKEAGIAS